MTTHKFNIKLFVESDTFGPTEFIPIFHHWIQNQSLPNHLLIDVADYAHVPAGPGSLLVAAEANIHMDRGENRLGLLYVRKQPIPAAKNFYEQLRGVLLETFEAAAKLEQEPELAGKLKFRTNEISIRLNDRLIAPNTAETLSSVKPEMDRLAKELFAGAPVTVEHYKPSPLTLFEVRIKRNESPSLATLIDRLPIIAYS